MAINKHMRVKAQPSIYSERQNDREIDVYYSLPKDGVNKDTGILLYICGFRGHAEANVFKKMRDTFADKYNLITVQCNYFGYEFMQNSKKTELEERFKNCLTEEELSKVYTEDGFQIEKFTNLIGGAPIEIYLKEDLSEENKECFAEMGIMQVMDNLNALLAVINKIKEDGSEFNSSKIIAFGNSHGSYLAHFCNILAPGLFSLIIDNSSWSFPRHLAGNSRVLTIKEQDTVFKVIFDYNARNIIEDFQILDLNALYSISNNKARIIAFHGQEDNLMTLDDKIHFIKNIENAEIHPITLDSLKNYSGIFSSIKHGLKADFLTLFDYVMENFDLNFDTNTDFKIPDNARLESSTHKYIIRFDEDIPKVIREKKTINISA